MCVRQAVLDGCFIDARSLGRCVSMAFLKPSTLACRPGDTAKPHLVSKIIVSSLVLSGLSLSLSLVVSLSIVLISLIEVLLISAPLDPDAARSRRGGGPSPRRRPVEIRIPGFWKPRFWEHGVFKGEQTTRTVKSMGPCAQANEKTQRISAPAKTLCTENPGLLYPGLCTAGT